MKIIYLHQYFKTPDQGGAVRSYYLAKALVDSGHEVEMITTHNEKKYAFKVIDGIKVHYLPINYHNKLRFLSRIFSFFRFMVLAYKKAASIPNVELCYATSTPLSIGWIALRLKSKLNIPYYFEVRDLWPEAPIQLGYIKSRFLKLFLYSFEKKIYLNATKIITLSTGMRDGVESKIEGKYASLLPNMSDCDFFKLEPKRIDLEQIFNVEGKFVISYIGALGKVNYLQSLIDVAKLSKKLSKPIVFLVAGDGSEVDYLKGEIRKNNLSNIHFLGFKNKIGIKEILNVSDASFVSFKNIPILETNSPNKFFDSIAAGKLIIVNIQGWIKETLESKNCGFYFDSKTPEDFIRNIEKYIEDNNLLLESQVNARKLAENYYSRSEITRNYLKLFDKTQRIDTVISSVYTLTA